MMIDFIEIQKHKFDQVVQKIMAEPQKYLDFEIVSDFYKSTWLDDLPKGTTWTVSGLDNGAEQFDIYIEYRNHYLSIHIQDVITLSHGTK
ncbi:hypothetical protein [Acinetobacter rongchengensis]|uniref:Uncharacterized protein n=1 Tax=Acinetobacter rongchengensis TaxID=2419601 RepID=A0A3A8FH65_9GAMM|nr:hypothetical protein [Acinetobacter rongchengensis]RKG40093.1 hypothetical protein D7V20_03205 [Acinetobacter rongchengensis]